LPRLNGGQSLRREPKVSSQDLTPVVYRRLLAPASLKDCRMVVRIEVFRNGTVQEAYTKDLAFEGSFTHPIPLALNQEKGSYRVRVTEVISGFTQELPFDVR